MNHSITLSDICDSGINCDVHACVCVCACDTLLKVFYERHQRDYEKSGEGFLFKTTEESWDQIYVWDKNGETFLVGSWAIKLDLLVHSPTNMSISVEWI